MRIKQPHSESHDKETNSISHTSHVRNSTPGIYIVRSISVSASNPNIVLDSSTCKNYLGGSWPSGSSTCTVTSAGISSGTTLVIPAGTTLVISNGGEPSTGLSNSGTIDNSGTITISNTGVSSTGLSNYEIIYNSGTISQCVDTNVVSSGFSGTAPTGNQVVTC